MRGSRSEQADPGEACAEGKALDPVLAAVRERGFSVLRAVGTVMALISLAVLVPRLLHSAPIGGPSMPLVLLLALAFGALSWAIPRRLHQLSAGVLIVAVGLIGALGIWSIGPSFAFGALVVTVPLLATFFFGPRLAIPAAATTAVALLAIGLVSWLADRPQVGALPGAAVPYPVYARLAIMALGSAVIALAAEHAALRAMEEAIGQTRAVAEHARAEHEARAAAERALAQSQRLETIGQLAGGVAHDTRNALLVMAAGLKDLRATRRSPQEEAVLTDLEHAVAGVKHTMQQLLLLGRRAGAGARPVPLSAVVAPFASALRRVIPPTIQLRVEAATDAAAVVDATGLEQAVLNLALNARDAMPSGGVLTLRLGEQAREGTARVVLEVEDTGTGMDARTAARVFEPFFTTKPAGEGTGLGLAQVQSFVTEAGGTVEVTSAVGRGTCVRLIFPRAPVDPAAQVVAPAGG